MPTCVDSGPAALDELRRASEAKQQYAAILLDAMMPQMDGFDVAERIAADPTLSGTPILMLTSADRKGDAARSRQLGIAAYLVKPVKSTELNLALAVALPAAAAAIVYTAHRDDRSVSGIRRLRILVAEDNPVNQRSRCDYLRRGGHAVTLANHGGEALAALECNAFDLVLMDVQMPEMDGFEATRAIRNREMSTGHHVPIVAMTAHAMKGDRERCLAAGMDDYLAKPVQRSELDRVLAWVAGSPSCASSGVRANRSSMLRPRDRYRPARRRRVSFRRSGWTVSDRRAIAVTRASRSYDRSGCGGDQACRTQSQRGGSVCGRNICRSFRPPT